MSRLGEKRVSPKDSGAGGLLNKILNWCNRVIWAVDEAPLWLMGIVLFVVTFAFYFSMGEGIVFEIHDQLDESLLNYVLTAKHLGEAGTEILPEMLGGVQASGMQPADLLAVPLYALLPTMIAFLVQYAYVFLCGFFGMYFCVRECTGSNILSLVAAGCFCMLPLYSIYGLSMYGIPLVLYAYLCLYRHKNITVSLLAIALFGVSSHLVCTGYVVLGFCALALLVLLFQRKNCKWLAVGFGELLLIYIILNRNLLQEFLLGNAGYVSHREEMMKYGIDFWESAKDCFLNSSQHAPSLHKYLIIPIILLLALGFFQRKGSGCRALHNAALAGFGLLVFIALFYGLCNSALVANLRNSLSGFLRYFQMERVYWIYPAAWYLEFALAFAVLWVRNPAEKETLRKWKGMVLLVALAVMLLPTLDLIKNNSIFYRYVNQRNNGSQITGYISWESWFAEDLMEELEQEIGRDMTTYRVAHLGISPAPAVMHGFYTVDGYSNNYPLEYKHRFREVIAAELDKAPDTAAYFDDWGNRCYLFNSQTGTYYMMAKNNTIVYENLEFDMEALKDLGCEYLFSGAEIADAERMGLDYLGYFDTPGSYWGIWLYALN